jgi:hypothetical protein
MHQIYHNDQAFIAEEYLYLEGHLEQTARIAFFKINSFKLSQINAAFCMTRDELSGSIKSSLLNYTQPTRILADLGFFVSEIEN